MNVRVLALGWVPYFGTGESSHPMTISSPHVGDPDLISGAPAIAQMIYGVATPKTIRRVRWQYETRQLPIFSLTTGGTLQLRVSTYRAHISGLEKAAVK